MPQIELKVRLQYSGGDLSAEEACDMVQNALEHTRQQGMLSDPELMDKPQDELSCDWITVRPEEK